jgi:hypothetical protein
MDARPPESLRTCGAFVTISAFTEALGPQENRAFLPLVDFKKKLTQFPNRTALLAFIPPLARLAVSAYGPAR